MESKLTHRLNIQLSEEQYLDLSIMAGQWNISRSDLLRLLIRAEKERRESE